MSTAEFSNNIGTVSKSLRPFAMRLTKDVDDANDLLQDTLLKAYVNREKFENGTNLKAWLFTIMKNTFISGYQKMMRQNTFVDVTENLHYINTLENSVQSAALSGFVKNDINKALNRLDETYRSPFMLYFKGFKYHEIANSLQIPIGTVKNRIHIARKELKDSLSIYAYSM